MRHDSSYMNGLLSTAASMMMSGYAKHQILKGFGTVSETQKIALDAGTADHEVEFFSGAPDWETLDDLPLPELSEGALDLLGEKAKILAGLTDDSATATARISARRHGIF